MASDGTIIKVQDQQGSRPLAPNERPVDAEAVAEVAGSSWHLQPGARELLTYCDMRNVYRVLLPYNVDTDEEAQAQALQLTKALQVPPFAHVLSHAEAEATRRAEPSAVVRAITELELSKTSNMMLVSDQSAALRAAKAARSYSCFFVKRLPGAPTKLPADFHAEDIAAVRTAIEDCNGVTYRDADTEIRSKFGVYQT